jgi:fumarylacetoacetase
VPVPAGSGFPLENLPYGVFSGPEGPHIGVAIGDSIFDLQVASRAGLFGDSQLSAALRPASLNELLGLGRKAWTDLRGRLQDLLASSSSIASEDRANFIVSRSDARMTMPFEVRDYVDFYSSLEHATNLGKIMRPGTEPLLPNWRRLPVGYHGRASTVVIDGTPVVRPRGQIKQENGEPEFGPTAMLDIELEVGFVTGRGNALGEPIPIERAREHIFGVVLVNDWSARDIQAWEYQPLGPFLGKSFATSISPWVVTLDALEPYRAAPPKQDPAPLPYLRAAQDWNYDIALEIALRTEKMRGENSLAEIVSRSNFKHLYWSMAQQLAHATSNGATITPGDLFASGTISGPEPGSYGSLIELTWRGTKPLKLSSSEERRFLEDGDEVTMTGYCEAPGKPTIGFGEVKGIVEPARR